MRINIAPYLEIFRSRRVAFITLFGFSSGLPLALSYGTLQSWMAVDGVNMKTIGAFALVGLPYTLKFLWSPLMDRFVPPFLDRRRGWILLTQLMLVAGIAGMALLSPSEMPVAAAALALFIAFSSASQDIVVDAYRTDVLREKERGFGAAVFVTGYRIAMIVSGALALIMADQIGWRATYLAMAGIMSAGILASLFGPSPDKIIIPPRTMTEAVWGPLRDFFARQGAIRFLLLIVLYKLCDAYAGALLSPFLIRGVGFSLTEVGTMNKLFGFASLIIGGLFGGMLMVTLGLFRSLMIFGVLQAVSILSFAALAWVGKSYPMMIFAVAFENMTGGMGTAAFVALLMALCNQRFSATQYALLSSIAALGRTFIAPTSGFLVEAVGWTGYFIFATLTALPALGILWWLKKDIEALKEES
ncbi:MAG: MFS transporter PAT family beta-lactamase induction signal transducer AmpG [Nitrospirae bacterium]|nr:MAG: MFS transporter PAT family beta-lactamase induction signal transducer AmpG [Nitrospirota bacterium]